jgi:hypothetical protein
MANPAAETVAEILAKYPGAATELTGVGERTRNRVHVRIGDPSSQSYHDCYGIGPFHYGASETNQISTAFQPGVAPWDYEMGEADFEIHAVDDLEAGEVWKYTDAETGLSVSFKPLALNWSNALSQIDQISIPVDVGATVGDDTLLWTGGYGTNRNLRIQAQTARLAKRLVIGDRTDLPEPPQFIKDGGDVVLELNLNFDFDAGLTCYVNGAAWGGSGQQPDVETAGLIEFRDDATGESVFHFNLPRSWDAAGTQQIGTFQLKKQGNSLYISHRVPWAFTGSASTLGTAVYPIEIDTDIEEDISVSADDGQWSDDSGSGSAYSNSLTQHEVGWKSSTYDEASCWYRFVNISGLSGATIVTSYISLWGDAVDSNDPLTKIWAEDAAAPAAPTDLADANSRVNTTAGVDWDNPGLSTSAYTNSPSINAVIQELADSYDPSVIQILHRNDGSGELWANNINASSYDRSTSEDPLIHIGYTAAGGGVSPTGHILGALYGPLGGPI